ncbi:hypothetical protein HHL19_18455 [Streptomyces sp. R302]|uniref:hypothetical protein n=1 Tax=unclassified Streptomyces TaxID=2593676 RepID=UPI00145D083C|nr:MULTISPECIES: hypothetical protein [unclassified Streptomyces]NML52469.1 hypothetical protein [Streptomyces sp. R301]NML80602.1 hypothetical protein [Streptomyces sp. R302]
MNATFTRRRVPAVPAAAALAVSFGTLAPQASADDGGAPFGPACASVPEQGAGSFAGMADDPVATAAPNKVNDTASVVCGDVQTSHATVHLIDTVLMPK